MRGHCHKAFFSLSSRGRETSLVVIIGLSVFPCLFSLSPNSRFGEIHGTIDNHRCEHDYQLPHCIRPKSYAGATNSGVFPNDGLQHISHNGLRSNILRHRSKGGESQSATRGQSELSNHRRLRGGYWTLPGCTKDRSKCDKFGIFYAFDYDMNGGKPGTPQEVQLGLADETYAWAAVKPRKDPNGDPRQAVVKGLPKEMKETECAEYFETYGEIIDCKIPIDEDTGKSQGVAFITYEDPDDAEMMIWDVNLSTRFKEKNMLRANHAQRGEYQSYIRKGGDLPTEEQTRLFNDINTKSFGQLAYKTYEDFMLQSRSASPEDDPRDMLYRYQENKLAVEPEEGAGHGVGKYADGNLPDPNAARLFAEKGQEPVKNQELVEGLLGARKGFLKPMFENEEEEERAVQDAMEMEGFGSGFDGEQGRSFQYGKVDYGDADVRTVDGDSKKEQTMEDKAKGISETLDGVPLNFVEPEYQEPRGHA
mmetsp:Transcript_20600/g.28787  ORF Transcript_20600/g.28787 Transcript_20600/m.28787 type:complete len:478 (+) Transcript_20600:45-1478(+)